MTTKTMEVTGTGAAGVDERRRPAAARYSGRIDTERGPTPIDVRVKIDQPRHDEEPARIHGLGAVVGEIVSELDYLSFAKRDVDDFVAVARRINETAASEDQVGHMRTSAETGWCDKTAKLFFEQSGKRDAAAVAILRTDDLHSDRQPFRRRPDRRHRRWQIHKPRQPRPKQVVGHRHAFAVD